MPMAGKLEYRVELCEGRRPRRRSPPGAAVTRFKGDVPAWILVPHVAAMFFGMLFSTRAAMAAAVRRRHAATWGYLTVALLVIGGFVLGPVVQKLAFGEYWTGIPWGYDLTDNKTLIAGVAWILAALQLRGGRQARLAVVAATSSRWWSSPSRTACGDRRRSGEARQAGSPVSGRVVRT